MSLVRAVLTKPTTLLQIIEFVGLKTLDKDGNCVGERCLGWFGLAGN